MGEYGAKIMVSLGYYVDYLIAVTPEGIRVDADGFGSCSYVVDTKTAETFLYDGNAQKCSSARFKLVEANKNSITFTFEDWEKSFSVPFLSGDMGEAWKDNAPNSAVIKGIKLGDGAPQSANELDGYTKFVDRGLLGQFAKTSIGFSGFSSTNYFDGARYLHGSAPQPLPGGRSISFDDIGVYTVAGDVVAVMRRFEPPEEQAPRYDATREALIATYGQPTIEKGGNFEWHHDASGALLTKSEGRNCEGRFNGDASNERSIFMTHQELESSLVEAFQGVPSRIEDKTMARNIRSTAECAYSIRYNIHSTEGGLLDRLWASMYAYDPLRSEIWNDRSARITDEIRKELKLQKNSADIKPDL